MSAEGQQQEGQQQEEQQPKVVTNLASLADAVNVKDFNIWQEQLLSNFTPEEKGKITQIINAVSNEVPAGEGKPILDSFKELQTKYVHVSLFASLSYVYITQLLQELKTTFEQNKIAALQVAKQESSVKVQDQLRAKAEEYSELENILQQRAERLNEFINKLASETAEAAPAGGSKRKKRAQKGGFIRDGTRASLAGDPYPKAS